MRARLQAAEAALAASTSSSGRSGSPTTRSSACGGCSTTAARRFGARLDGEDGDESSRSAPAAYRKLMRELIAAERARAASRCATRARSGTRCGAGSSATSTSRSHGWPQEGQSCIRASRAVNSACRADARMQDLTPMHSRALASRSEVSRVGERLQEARRARDHGRVVGAELERRRADRGRRAPPTASRSSRVRRHPAADREPLEPLELEGRARARRRARRRSRAGTTRRGRRTRRHPSPRGGGRAATS